MLAHAHASHLTGKYQVVCFQAIIVRFDLVARRDLAAWGRHLRLLILKDVAEVTNLHESTLSRVTANKNMMMPCRGFELRHFFSAAIASVVGGDAHSSTSVRDRIREFIQDEAPLAVLSDDAIGDILLKKRHRYCVAYGR